MTDKKLKHHHLPGCPFCFKIKPLFDHLGYDYEDSRGCPLHYTHHV